MNDDVRSGRLARNRRCHHTETLHANPPEAENVAAAIAAVEGRACTDLCSLMW